MNRQHERDEFIELMAREGIKAHVSRLIMRHAATLHRLAELQCSSEAYDRDRIPCPQDKVPYIHGGCLCEASGNKDGDVHGDVPRGDVKEARLQHRLVKELEPYGITPVFQGDPRGAVVKLKVPSGKTNDWGREGVCVP